MEFLLLLLLLQSQDENNQLLLKQIKIWTFTYLAQLVHFTFYMKNLICPFETDKPSSCNNSGLVNITILNGNFLDKFLPLFTSNTNCNRNNILTYILTILVNFEWTNLWVLHPITCMQFISKPNSHLTLSTHEQP